MDTLGKLRQGLSQEKEFKPVEELNLPEIQALPKEGFVFVGAREYWGSVASIGLVQADGLTEDEIKTLCERFFAITKSLKKYANVLVVHTLKGSGAVQLGSFGLLCFVYENGCSRDLIEFIQKQKRGSASEKHYAVYWVLDPSARQVHTHRWFPLSVFPGKKYLRSLLT